MAEAQADVAESDAESESAQQQLADRPVEEQLAHWKSEARKAQDRLRDKGPDQRAQQEMRKERDSLRREVEQLKQQSMTDTEKAVAQARADGLAEGAKAAGGKLVSAEIRAAAAGRNVDVDALVEGIDPSRFLGDDGEPNRDAITAWVDKVAPKGETAPSPFPDLGQGTPGKPLELGSDPLTQTLTKMVGR